MLQVSGMSPMDKGWPRGWDVSGSAGLGLCIHGRKAEKERKGEKEREVQGRAPRKMFSGQCASAPQRLLTAALISSP